MQLIEFMDDISKNLQEGQQTDILILDFAKAFDKVKHSLLIHKLQHYGNIGKSVRWIQSWLANSKQSVVGFAMQLRIQPHNRKRN
jgi:hypothetical protein